MTSAHQPLNEEEQALIQTLEGDDWSGFWVKRAMKHEGLDDSLFDFGEKKLELGDIFITSYNSGPYVLVTISKPCNCYQEDTSQCMYQGEESIGIHYHLGMEDLAGKGGYHINSVDEYGTCLWPHQVEGNNQDKCKVVGKKSWVMQELF